jgi:hypothetical protein
MALLNLECRVPRSRSFDVAVRSQNPFATPHGHVEAQ